MDDGKDDESAVNGDDRPLAATIAAVSIAGRALGAGGTVTSEGDDTGGRGGSGELGGGESGPQYG